MDIEDSTSLLGIIMNSDEIFNGRVFVDLSHELLCHILKFLPLRDVLSMSMLCRKLTTAVGMYLRLIKYIDFCEGKIYSSMPSSITDDHMHALFKKCPHVEFVYGLHPQKVERRRLRRRSALTVPGIIEALSLCCNLKAVEISDLRLLEAVMQHLPQLEIIGNFQNRDGVFPPHASHRLKLQPYPRVSSLHLVGVEVPELTAMPHLEHLHLQCVRFTKLQPFRAFLAQNLKSFVMKHCMGPSMSLRYLSLIIALSSSPSLTRLELVRVPLPGGLFQRAIEDSYRHNGFVNLKQLVIAGCKGVLESDLGHLMIVSSKNLESICIQPSLTRDSLFVSLSFAQCEFPKLKNLHLGFVDKLSISGDWSNDTLLTLGLAEVPDTPSSLTDSGMKIILELFPKLKSLSVSNCPHLMAMDQWYSTTDERGAWKELTDLTLQRCHCLQLPSFALFLAFLPKIEVVILNDMFREPPKGCSHVGLSAGTGLGMSSAVVSNQDEHIAVPGHQQDFDAQADDRMEQEDIDRDFIDGENERNQEPHLMVLQEELFDDQNNGAGAPIERVEQDRGVDSDLDHAASSQDSQSGDVQDRQCTDTESEVEEDSLSAVQEKGENSNTSEREFSKNEHSEHNYSSFLEPYAKDSDDSNNESELKSNNIHQSKKKAISHKKFKSNKRGKCKQNCVISFDPTQPSTSKSGNCAYCPCETSDTEIEANDYSYFQDSISHSNCNEELEPSTNSCSKKTRSVSDEDSEPSKSSSFAHCEKCLKNEWNSSDGVSQNISNELNNKEIENVDDSVKCSNSEIITKDKNVKDNDITDENDVENEVSMKHSRKRRKPKKLTFSKARKLLVKDSLNEDPSHSARVCSRQNTEEPKDVITSDHNSDCIEDSNSDSSIAAIRSTKCTATTSINMINTKGKKYKRHKRCKRLTKLDKKYKSGKSYNCRSNRKRANDDYNIVSQGTQATSADIRRSLRRQKMSPSPKRKGERHSSNQSLPTSNQISARQQHKRPKRKVECSVQNKATSTSDPLMEDDPVQNLRLVSESLITLSVISCGISDIVVDHCHTLTHIEVQACRILKRLQLLHCPYLQRLNISQCPKLEMQVVVPEVLSLVSNTNLLVSYEPCLQVYYPGISEKALFSRAYVDQSVILVHDYTSDANENIQATFKENLLGWMGIVQKMHNSALPRKAKHKRRRSKRKESKLKYPWGHQLRRIHGLYAGMPTVDCEATKWKYQILTNDRLFAAAIEVMSWERGIPPPCRSLECEAENQFLSTVTKEIFNKKLLRRLITFYIPVIEGN